MGIHRADAGVHAPNTARPPQAFEDHGRVWRGQTYNGLGFAFGRSEKEGPGVLRREGEAHIKEEAVPGVFHEELRVRHLQEAEGYELHLVSLFQVQHEVVRFGVDIDVSVGRIHDDQGVGRLRHGLSF